MFGTTFRLGFCSAEHADVLDLCGFENVIGRSDARLGARLAGQDCDSHDRVKSIDVAGVLFVVVHGQLDLRSEEARVIALVEGGRKGIAGLLRGGRGGAGLGLRRRSSRLVGVRGSSGG